MASPLFGWVPLHRRSDAMLAAHDAALKAMPRFEIKGTQRYGKKVLLYDWSKQANGGKHLDCFRQETGSCVGQGGGKTIWTLAGVQAAKLGELISMTLPFFLVAYGKSRELCGMRGKGDGSTGSGFARAAKEFGVPPSDLEGLPKPTMSDGLCFGRGVEMAFSHTSAIDRKWFDAAKPHLVRTVANVKTADEVRDAIVNGYPCTIASMWGGRMKCPVEDGLLMNQRSTSWPHQMCVLAWQEHDRHGEVFWIQNSWGPGVHGTCPSGAPPGGFWVRKKDMDGIAREGDSFAFSAFQGFPAQDMELDWYV